MEAGAYVDVTLHNQPKFLIDNGATVTSVSHVLFYRIQKKERSDHKPITQVLISENGTELSVAGNGKFCIDTGQEKFIVQALVTDLSIEGIFDLDFMKRNVCKRYLQQETLQCKSNTYLMAFSGNFQPLKISVYDQKHKLFAKIINDYDTSTSKLQIGNTESCKKFVKRDNALLEKTLVEAREHVPIRLLNVSNNVTTIRTGTTVGEVSPVH